MCRMICCLAGAQVGPQYSQVSSSTLETGKPLAIEMRPPKEMMAALQRLGTSGMFDRRGGGE